MMIQKSRSENEPRKLVTQTHDALKNQILNTKLKQDYNPKEDYTENLKFSKLR